MATPNPRDPNMLLGLINNPTGQPTPQPAPINAAPAQVLQQITPEQMAPPPPDGKMSPEQFMEMIRQNPDLLRQAPAEAAPQTNYGTKLVETKDGGLGVREPVNNPLALFGLKTTRKIDPTNYYDTLVARIGEDAAKAMLPGNTPVTPEGQPFLTAKTFDRISTGMGKASEADKPNKSVAQLALARLETTYGKDHPVYLNAVEAIKDGLPLNKLSEFINPLKPSKDEDTVTGANGIVMQRNRVTGDWQPVPGQTTGIMGILGDKASKDMFDTKLQDFRSDPVAKQLQVTLDALTNSSALLESDNPAALGSFFGNIARSIGQEKGPLNEGDIQRAVGDSSYGGMIARFLGKRGLTVEDFNKGTLSDRDLADFRGLVRDMGISTNKRYESALTRHVQSTVKTLPGLDEKFVRSAFDTANRFQEADQRALKGQATNYSGPSAGTTKSGVKYKVIP